MMIKSIYADPALQDRGFVNHIHSIVRDLGVYPGTTDPLIECYKVELIQNIAGSGASGGKPRSIALFRKVLAPHADPTSGTWSMIKMWVEAVDYDDSSAAGSVDMLPDGTLHIVMSFGKKNAAGVVAWQPWEASVVRGTFAPPIVRLPSAGTPGPAGPQGPKGDKGDPGTGTGSGISPADRATLDWAAAMKAAIGKA